MILWAIDPAVRLLAVAEFLDRVFTGVWFAPALDAQYRPDEVVCEMPEVYPGQPARDVPDLLRRVGGVEQWCADRRIRYLGVLPRAWKRQQPKPVHHWRVWSVLTPVERQVFARCVGRTAEDVEGYVRAACTTLARTGEVRRYSRRDHNLFDATGLGLWRVGRIDAAGRVL